MNEDDQPLNPQHQSSGDHQDNLDFFLKERNGSVPMKLASYNAGPAYGYNAMKDGAGNANQNSSPQWGVDDIIPVAHEQ